jgi:hypothetical protein
MVLTPPVSASSKRVDLLDADQFAEDGLPFLE